MNDLPISSSSPWPRWRVPAILLIFTIYFYWDVLFTNRFMFPWDASDFFYPYLAYIHEELRHLRFPLWDPYVMSGFPIIGDPEAQIFYPVNWLMVLLRPFSPIPFKMIEVVEVLHFFLAGLFMYRLAKDFTKDDLSALFGGLLFMSSGAMVAHTQHFASVEAMTWYPLVFLLARRGLLERNFVWAAWAGFFMGLENLVGHLQHAVYLGLLLFLYFAYEACVGPARRRLWPHWMVHLGAIGAIGAGLAMVQLVPTAQLGPQSIRTHISYVDVTGGNDLGFLLTLFLPNFWGGLSGVPYTGHADPSFNYVFLTVPGCLLALVGLIGTVRRRDFFWLGLILLTVGLTLGRGGFLADVVYHIPVLNLFRQMPVYFDLGNLALCLMAAIGAHALLDAGTREHYRRWLPAGLTAMLIIAFVLGVYYELPGKVQGWYHMLVASVLTTLLIVAWLRDWPRPRFAAAGLLLLTVFEFGYYSRNAWFNHDPGNPGTFLSYDFAGQRSESVAFLRADRSGDFRVAALDGSPWGSNGCNIWRLPCIFGWNPIMLRNYQDTFRQFIRATDCAQPMAWSGHLLESQLLDLLGVKYLLAAGPAVEQQRLADSRKFEKVFAERDWRTIYRNKDYLARSWFFPHAYVLPDRELVLALFNSHWFETRRTLLFASEDLPPALLPQVEPLQAITIAADRISGSSAGGAEYGADCAASRPVFKHWEGTNNWIRFEIDGVQKPGRYVLLAEYVSAGSEPPVMITEVAQDGMRQSFGPTTWPQTGAWNCWSSRSVELGAFEFAAGHATVTVKHQNDPAVDLFALRLISIPAGKTGSQEYEHASASAGGSPDAVQDFAFRDFDAGANRYAFTADLENDGFVLLNEVYYPGWEARVDGKPTAILPGDYAFRVLAVAAGSHRIVMEFRPPRLWLAGAISLFTFAGLIGFLRFRGRSRREGAGK
jgi:hypothetical protein